MSAGWAKWLVVTALGVSLANGASAQSADAGVPAPAVDAGPAPDAAAPSAAADAAGPPPEGAEAVDAPPSAAQGTAPAPTPSPSTTSTSPATATPARPSGQGAAPTPLQAAATEPSRASSPSPAERADEEEPEAEDRFRFMYLELSAGYSWINLAVLKEQDFVPEFQKIEGSGFSLGGGAGFFISFLTLGIQADWANHDGFDVGTASLDLGIRIPTPHVEPYLRAGVGYAWLFNLEATDASGAALWSEAPTIRGVAFDFGVGLDIMISRLVAIGLGVDVGVFNVNREGGRLANPTGVTLEDNGDAVGIQVSGLVQLNLHF